MIKILCKSEEEINYIIKKYDYNLSSVERADIRRKLNNIGYVFLIKMSHFLSVHCENICNGCVYDDICKPHIINTTIASEIMREEKIKRILYD